MFDLVCQETPFTVQSSKKFVCFILHLDFCQETPFVSSFVAWIP
jgi:hypothetical protein